MGAVIHRNQGLFFALPALALMATLILYPLAYTGWLSVTTDRGGFVGVENFATMIDDSVTALALRNTAVYVGFSVALQVSLGAAVGILLNQRFRGRALVRSIVLIPWVVPAIVTATNWAWMFHTEFGIVNYMLTKMGVIAAPVGWLTTRATVLPALIAVNVWQMAPFVAVMVLAGLQTIPEAVYEAARIDGAAFRHEVRYVMLPHLRPVLLAVTLLLTDLGLQRHHHHLHHDPRRPGQPIADHADPDLQARVRVRPLQPGGSALDHAVRVPRHPHRHLPPCLPTARGAMKRIGTIVRGVRPVYPLAALLVLVVPLPVRVDGAVVDQGAPRALHGAADLDPGGADPRELPEGGVRLDDPALLPQQRDHLARLDADRARLRDPAAYGFARFRFRGRRLGQACILAGQLLPTAAIIVPLFIVMRVLGLVNTYAGLILVYLILTLPLSVWMLTGYFRAIPFELEEAAIIDGASRLGVLFRITFPLSLPGVVAMLIYSFVTTWNEFIFALCFALDSRVKTLPIGLAEFSTEFNTDWGAVMAASMVMTIPVLIMFFAMQRLFVGGLTSGATQG